MKVLTEEYVCPLSGSDPGDQWRFATRPADRRPLRPDAILIPGQILPADTTDVQAAHECAMWRAESWSRRPDGLVILWVEM